MISRSPYLFTLIGPLCLLVSGGLFSDGVALSFCASQPTNSPIAFQAHPQNFGLIPSRTPSQHVSIADLLDNSQDYHQQVVSVRGRITQPELHLDDTTLYLDFVFRLSQGTHTIVVYGRHDRTQGAPPIVMNHSVEVIGTFWKEQDRNGAAISNILEAISVTPYPSPIPEST